jgi:hypothetical protein
MDEVARKARNTQRLTELFPAFARRVQAIIQALEADGYRPRIQDGWRSPQSQLEAFESGNSKLRFGFHNITSANGAPESLAVDLLDDDFPLNSRSDYLLRLAGVAAANRCQTGVAWGLPPALRLALLAAVERRDWNARLKIGWDPTHVEPQDVTVEQAQSGVRPTEFVIPPELPVAVPPAHVPRRKPKKARKRRHK